MQRMKQVLGVILLTGLLVTLSSPALAAPGEARRALAPEKPYFAQAAGLDTITVFGFGSSRGMPEEAQVSFGLTTFAPQAGTALEKHRLLLEKIVRDIQGLGIDPKAMTGLYFNIWPEYAYGADGFSEPETTGYRVNSTISVHVTDTLLLPGVIEGGLAAGANRLEGIRYLAPPKLKEEALTAALEDGLGQAQAMAAALGRRVDRLISIDESISPPYELWEERTPTNSSSFAPQDLEVNRCLCLVFCLK
ncbi:MAG: SIMPL domain-containing protein [Firmicutes bacterium]|nr:SIMPL domain-containing protein [Bacillota bacterium]